MVTYNHDYGDIEEGTLFEEETASSTSTSTSTTPLPTQDGGDVDEEALRRTPSIGLRSLDVGMRSGLMEQLKTFRGLGSSTPRTLGETTKGTSSGACSEESVRSQNIQTAQDINLTKKNSTFSTETNLLHEELTWSEVNMNLKDRDGKVQRTILKDVHGMAKVGETTAILGSSGAGKSSLLSILTGRTMARGKISIEHNIRLAGIKIDPGEDERVRNSFAFVAQEDSLHASTTPRESMTFSAKLRLPRTTTDEAIDDLVDSYIKELGLLQCADSVIGGGMQRGISGGERRRTAIGVELVTNPASLFGDELTSGLDSFAAKQVLALLKKVARRGNIVMFTIHQPSSEVFASFDRVILMHQGRTMYVGAANHVATDFGACGFPLPPRHNPADFVLDVAQEHDTSTLEQAGFFAPALPSEPKLGSVPDKLEFPARDNASWWTEFRMVMARERDSMIRTPTPLIVSMTITVFLSVVSGVIFFRVGAEDRADLLVLQGQLGALINVLIVAMMGQAETALTTFSKDRPVFLREYATQHYSIVPYFASHLATQALQSFAAVIVQVLVVYFMVGFQQSFGLFLAAVYALSMASVALSVLLGAACSDVKSAFGLFNLAIVPQFYFSGIFVPVRLIPSWIRWVQWLCSLTYASRLTMLYEFRDCGEDEQEICDEFLNQNGVSVDGEWWYWFALFAWFAIFQLLAVLTLRRKGITFQ